MSEGQYRRKIRMLWIMVVMAVIYCGMLWYAHTLVGVRLVDGAIGLILGLYICSHPAANTIDVLFFERGGLRQIAAEWSGLRWLGLNLLALVAGWAVIVVGAIQLMAELP